MNAHRPLRFEADPDPRAASPVPGRWGMALRQSYARHCVTIWLVVALALCLAAGVYRWIVVTVPSGFVGVAWHRFGGGTQTDFSYGEGTHVLWPWNRLTLYDARIRQIGRNFDVLTQDGMAVDVDVAVRYRIDPGLVGLLHKTVGPDYVDVLLMPAIGSYARLVFSRNSTESVYSTRRADIQDEIRRAAMADLLPRLGGPSSPASPWLDVHDVLIRSIAFPPDVQAAVNRKMQQAQVKEEFGYRLDRERLESQRKQVEAEGIARFQAIVGAGISDNYLRWKGIDATLALAQSSNSKVVVIGTAKDGMPLILGGAEAGRPPAGAPGSPMPPTSDGSAGPNRAPVAETPATTLAPAPETAVPTPSAAEAVGQPAPERPRHDASLLGGVRSLATLGHLEAPPPDAGTGRRRVSP